MDKHCQAVIRGGPCNSGAAVARVEVNLDCEYSTPQNGAYTVEVYLCKDHTPKELGS